MRWIAGQCPIKGAAREKAWERVPGGREEEGRMGRRDRSGTWSPGRLAEWTTEGGAGLDGLGHGMGCPNQVGCAGGSPTE